MFTDTWKKCPGSQPHQPHLRGWAEGPGRPVHLESWGGNAMVFCMTSFSSNSGFLYLWRTAWKLCIFLQRALNRVKEICRALPTTIYPPHIHTYTHTSVWEEGWQKVKVATERLWPWCQTPNNSHWWRQWCANYWFLLDPLGNTVVCQEMKENVCAYKIIWKINAGLSIFLQLLESRNVLQTILASSKGGREIHKYRQGGWAERSSCCWLLLSFTWRNAQGAWDDAGRAWLHFRYSQRCWDPHAEEQSSV